MTKEEILAMEAGEELDKMVAEALGDVFETPDHGKCYRHFQKNPAYGGWSIPAPVSTDILSAWHVVDRLVGTAYYYMFDLKKVYINTLWEASFEGRVAQGKTVPEAICKAALLISVENG
jgi:hypothetical protein